MTSKYTLLRTFSLLFTAWSSLFAGPVVFISNSPAWTLPENLSLAPAGYGTLGGTLVVPDAGLGSNNSSLYSVPLTGGAPTLIAGPWGATILSGAFLPANYGANAGNYLAAGYIFDPTAGQRQELYTVTASGTVTQVYGGTLGLFEGAAIAPSGFGSAGNDLVATLNTSGGNSVQVLNSSFTPSTLATLPTPLFGLTFAPAGFGSFGGDLLVTSLTTGAIYAVDSAGHSSTFSTLPLLTGQVGLRQMAFAPAGFGSYGGDLFVSVGSSTAGGGCCGSVDVIDPTGSLVAILNQGTVGLPFDPRGLYFTPGLQLLISDADPGILAAPASAFTAPTPEPGTLVLMGLGLGGLVLGRRRILGE